MWKLGSNQSNCKPYKIPSIQNTIQNIEIQFIFIGKQTLHIQNYIWHEIGTKNTDKLWVNFDLFSTLNDSVSQ